MGVMQLPTICVPSAPDIKCDNLLVEKNGDVKLADFGQSKDASEILKTVTGPVPAHNTEHMFGSDSSMVA